MTLALWIIVFFILGILVYYLDAQYGLNLYRGWYNLTHKEKLPEDVYRGFVVGQKFLPRILLILLFVAVEVVVSVLYSQLHPMQDILLGLAEVVGMLIGFIVAPKVLQFLPGKVSRTIEYMDKVESGEVNLKQDIIQSAVKVTSEIKEAASEKQVRHQPVKEEPLAAKEKPAPPQKDAAPDDGKKDDDWRRGVKDFLNK